MAGNGVALIVVHGVADQAPGETARSVVDLLVAAEPHGCQWRAVGSREVVLEVEPLAPRSGLARRVNATPRGDDRSVFKAGLQSMRSDFQRPGWQAPVAPGAAPAAPVAPSPDADRGIEASNYLLAKHRDNGAGDEAYETRCIEVERRSRDDSARVAVYELYWADLSRLSGALPRIVTELFTLVFRLSKLGRDTVDEARRARAALSAPGDSRRRAWAVTAWLQIGLDWLFANVLALLFAQLFLLGIVFAVLGLAALLEVRLWLYLATAAAFAVLGVLVFAYQRRGALTAPGRWAPPAVLALACFAALCMAPLRPWVSGLLLIGAVTFVYEIVLGIGNDRFPLVRLAGRTLWFALLALMAASAVHEIAGVGHRLDPESFDVGWHAALFGLEVTLLAIKWWWIVAGMLLVVWFAAGAWAGRGGHYEWRASIATGRLGLALSLATFLTLSMAIWTLLTSTMELAARNVAYQPCIFAFDEAVVSKAHAESTGVGTARQVVPPPVYPPTLNRCLWRSQASTVSALSTAPTTPASGGLFLYDRYVGTTATFSLVAVLLLALIAYLATVFTPSVLAEMKILASRAGDQARRRVAARRRARSHKLPRPGAAEIGRIHRLGRWLTAGFRRLDFAVFLIVGAGVAFGLVVAGLFLVGLVSGPAVHLASRAGEVIDGLSRVLLKPLVLTVAGLGTAFSVLGGVLSKYLPALRAPLDIALDVDNHFREFPRTGIPRARIFARYAALLRHVRAEGHTRIVVVAHSQGTVISAELLRFLASDGAHAPGPDDRPRLDGRPLPAIGLLTLGCPLRQLYAARFPTLYRWVIARKGRLTGPRAHDVGVVRWINAFCSGDYVGRWLWSDSDDDGEPIGSPMVDTVAGTFGRRLAYDPFVPMPPMVAPFNDASALEVCLGLGAHTHYFEADQRVVAWLVDSLVAG